MVLYFLCRIIIQPYLKYKIDVCVLLRCLHCNTAWSYRRQQWIPHTCPWMGWGRCRGAGIFNHYQAEIYVYKPWRPGDISETRFTCRGLVISRHRSRANTFTPADPMWFKICRVILYHSYARYDYNLFITVMKGKIISLCPDVVDHINDLMAHEVPSYILSMCETELCSLFKCDYNHNWKIILKLTPHIRKIIVITNMPILICI